MTEHLFKNSFYVDLTMIFLKTKDINKIQY